MKRLRCILLILMILLVPIKVQAAEGNQFSFTQEEEVNHPEETEHKKETENKGEDSLDLASESAVLMEASTGKILYEKNGDSAKPPASVTKIMTLLLIFEDLQNGKTTLTDNVTVSAHAASMGGSQVFLEAGEVQTVDTLIKCIAVSSANDGCVAMAEHLNGSEEAFVNRMNEKAKELGMENTHFINCCGLDAEGHMTTARDIALMSRELTTKYPDIFQYTTIWMDEFVHKTDKGESVFGLSSTNKMLKSYQGCNGLKTGSTSKAKFCLSATATRNDVSLIGVVMAAPDSKTRTKDMTKLLDYGFANVEIYEDAEPLGDLKKVDISGGEEKSVGITTENPFRCVITSADKGKEITKNIRILDPLKAPVKEKEIIGEVEYLMDGQLIGSVPIHTKSAVKEKTYLFCLESIWKQLVLMK